MSGMGNMHLLDLRNSILTNLDWIVQTATLKMRLSPLKPPSSESEEYDYTPRYHAEAHRAISGINR